MCATGVPEFEYLALGQDAIHQELQNKYPDFEKRTGWRLDSQYKEMPEQLAEDVSNHATQIVPHRSFHDVTTLKNEHLGL